MPSRRDCRRVRYLINSGIIAGQNASGAASTASPDLGRRAAQLQDRHERQTSAGLVDAAARTSKELEQMARMQDACSDYWSRGVPPPTIGKFGLFNNPQRKLDERPEKAFQTRRAVQLAARAGTNATSGLGHCVAQGSCQRGPASAQAFVRRTGARDEDRPGRAKCDVRLHRVTASLKDAAYNASLGADSRMQELRAALGATQDAMRAIRELNNSVAFDDLAEAKASYERALAGLDGPSSAPAALVALDTLRLINERLGDVPEALRNVRSALAILESRYGSESWPCVSRPVVCGATFPCQRRTGQGDRCGHAMSRAGRVARSGVADPCQCTE